MDKARKARKRFWDCRQVGNSMCYPVMSAKKSLKQKRVAIAIHRSFTSSTKPSRLPGRALIFRGPHYPQHSRHPLLTAMLHSPDRPPSRTIRKLLRTRAEAERIENENFST